MATRPTWQGHLKLSLVTCPVALYAATSSAGDVRFHLINPATHNRIRMVTTDPDTGPVERSDLVKGYEVAKDEYVLFDEADFDKVRLESTKTIAIDQFVNEADIDRLYWDDPFYVVPEKGVGVEAFAVIREAMKSAGKIALGQLVLRGKERQLALEVHGKGLVAYTLRAHDEVKKGGPNGKPRSGAPIQASIEAQISTDALPHTQQLAGSLANDGIHAKGDSSIEPLVLAIGA